MSDMENLTVQDVVEDLKNTFGSKVLEVTEYQGDTLVRVEKNSINQVCSHLKEHHRFIYLIDIFGTDRFTSEDRFEVIYNLVSLKHQLRLFLKIRLPEENPAVVTVTDIWTGANWNERETYDMFGIVFEGHPDLRRIFMPEDFKYFPLRKEFPLLGIPGSLELPGTTPNTE
jgi:NADH-quinone oxidoreductase subunit C